MYSDHPYRAETFHRRRTLRDFLSTLWRVLLVAGLIAAMVAAYLRWPRIRVVETGRTPEYRELKPRDYDRRPADSIRAARAAIDSLGWSYLGSGSGPGGSEIRATVHPWHLPLRCDVVIRIKGSGGRSTLNMRSESQYGPWDFGQNARNIRAFLHEMDAARE